MSANNTCNLVYKQIKTVDELSMALENDGLFNLYQTVFGDPPECQVWDFEEVTKKFQTYFQYGKVILVFDNTEKKCVIGFIAAVPFEQSSPFGQEAIYETVMPDSSIEPILLPNDDNSQNKTTRTVFFNTEFFSDSLSIDTSTALYIADIGVDSRYRGNGVASNLLSLIDDMSLFPHVEVPFTCILLRVSKTRDSVMKLYERAGFSLIPSLYQASNYKTTSNAPLVKLIMVKMKHQSSYLLSSATETTTTLSTNVDQAIESDKSTSSFLLLNSIHDNEKAAFCDGDLICLFHPTPFSAGTMDEEEQTTYHGMRLEEIIVSLKLEMNQWENKPLVILGYLEYYFIKHCTVYVDQFPNFDMIIVVEPSGDLTLDYQHMESVMKVFKGRSDDGGLGGGVDNRVEGNTVNRSDISSSNRMGQSMIDLDKLQGSKCFCALNQEFALPLLISSRDLPLSKINPCSTWIFPSHLPLTCLIDTIPYLIHNNEASSLLNNRLSVMKETDDNSGDLHSNVHESKNYFSLPSTQRRGNGDIDVHFGPLQLSDLDIPVRQYCDKWGEDYDETLSTWTQWVTHQPTCGLWYHPLNCLPSSTSTTASWSSSSSSPPSSSLPSSSLSSFSSASQQYEEHPPAPHDTSLIRRRPPQLIGWGVVYPWGAIGSLNIDESHRGQGYGKVIVQYLIRELRNKGLTPYSHVEEHNKLSAKVHEALGFVKLPHDVVWATL